MRQAVHCLEYLAQGITEGLAEYTCFPVREYAADTAKYAFLLHHIFQPGLGMIRVVAL